MMTGIEIYEKQATVLLLVKGQLDILTAAEFRHLCDGLVARGVIHFMIDLSQTPMMDSAGVAALVNLLKRCRTMGGTIKLGKIMSPAAQRILRLTRFDQIFELVEITHEPVVRVECAHQNTALAQVEQNKRRPVLALAPTVLEWQNVVTDYARSLSSPFYVDAHVLLNATVNAFMQRVNRQFSVS